MHFTPAMEAFVRHWGEMGARWGVSRSVAQIHALLYLAEEPLPAETICEVLDIARSNVSTSLRELMGYQLIDLVHVAGDRRDHFRAKQDPWDMLLAIVEERKRREIDPALAMVRSCVAQAAQDAQTPNGAAQRMQAMLALLTELDTLYVQLRALSRPTLQRAVKLGDRLVKLL
ncbi:MAG TPA: ArsR family transcriptional regulator [Alphaproteobacteria bacterium]|nr:ArsR family transcriptional regulator [Alphaproteobacteria bacterium]